MAKSSYDALRLTAFVVDKARALGESKHLCADVLSEMDESSRLFAQFGIRIPYRVTKTEVIYFTKIKGPLQELAIQCINILRYHEDAEVIAKYLIPMRLPNELSDVTLKKATDFVRILPKEFDLDMNYFPIRRATTFNCDMKAFMQHDLKKLNYSFVDNMEEFWETPTPRRSKHFNYGLRATSKEFDKLMHSTNILLAY